MWVKPWSRSQTNALPSPLTSIGLGPSVRHGCRSDDDRDSRNHCHSRGHVLWANKPTRLRVLSRWQWRISGCACFWFWSRMARGNGAAFQSLLLQYRTCRLWDRGPSLGSQRSQQGRNPSDKSYSQPQTLLSDQQPSTPRLRSISRSSVADEIVSNWNSIPRRNFFHFYLLIPQCHPSSTVSKSFTDRLLNFTNSLPIQHLKYRIFGNTIERLLFVISKCCSLWTHCLLYKLDHKQQRHRIIVEEGPYLKIYIGFKVV